MPIRTFVLWRQLALASAIAGTLSACSTSHGSTVPATATPNTSPTPAAEPFDAWLGGLRSEAVADGISQGTLDAALTNLQPIQGVLDLENAQPEVKLTYEQYLARTVTDQRAAQGQKLLAQYRPLLMRVSAAYSVPPQYIVALWGVESDYGRVTGGYPVIGALATLAYSSERKAMFRTELIDALQILDQKNIGLDGMTGSWAGAMGQCQFLPSSYLKYAVDFSGDGRRDIWTDQADVFASIANYLHSYKWDPNEAWGRAVRLPAGFDAALIDWKTAKPVEEWQGLGVRNSDGSNLASSAVPVALVASGGVAGPAYLVSPNFNVIMKWNRSTYFATSVGLLADRIGG